MLEAILRGWRERLFHKDLASTFLDDLVDELRSTVQLERRTALWAEILRRFNQDVERACRAAQVGNSQETAAGILDACLRGVELEESKYFSLHLVRVMKLELGFAAVNCVVRSLYIRQFVTELPPDLTRYANAFFDHEMVIPWIVEALNEDEAQVLARIAELWKRWPAAIQREFSDPELSDRTDGVWTYDVLKRP